MFKHIKIGNCNIVLMSKHRFGKQNLLDRAFSKWEIGIWFKKNKVVGTNKFNKPSDWKNNLVNNYTVAIEMLLFKIQVVIDFGGKHLDTKNENL